MDGTHAFNSSEDRRAGGAGRGGARRATGEAGPAGTSRATAPDPEVPAKAQRRRFSGFPDGRREMNRRAFLAVGVRTVTFALAASAARRERLAALEKRQASADGVEQRVAAVIRAYDAQGNHRTGTEVDKASAEWLANEVRQFGAEPSFEAFPLSRVDPQSCYLR